MVFYLFFRYLCAATLSARTTFILYRIATKSVKRFHAVFLVYHAFLSLFWRFFSYSTALVLIGKIKY